MGLVSLCRRTRLLSGLPWQHSLPVKSRPTCRASSSTGFRSRPKWQIYSTTLLIVSGAAFTLDQFSPSLRYTVIAAQRCSTIGRAVVLDVIDYKRTMSKTYETEEDRLRAYSECHLRSAQRVLRALLINGGIYVKLGQHVSSLAVLPVEWTSTLRPLQDQCHATPYQDIDAMLVEDTGRNISDWFQEFEQEPIGVASLAQVHVARDQTGRKVAVKLQHPGLLAYSDVDMATVEICLAWVKRHFPEFEFTWLGEEMRENLPKELNFVHEASNAERLASDFRGVKTSLYVPRVLFASKRLLVMEYIEGGRVDDKEYLAAHNIDRNTVALELARIFSRMVHLNGWFHADPHLGNLFIRQSPAGSNSPYNFEIVMLDHGLHFDIEHDLRINYSKLWLSFISPTTPETTMERRKYAELVGNIGPDLYPVFQTAITGRVGLEDDKSSDLDMARPSSIVDMLPQTSEELEIIRNAVLQQDGILESVFDVLRRVPRRVLMLLKLNDLTRSLDKALATTHSNVRVFLITARYCSLAVWLDDRHRLLTRLREDGLFSPRILCEYLRRWWSFQCMYQSFRLMELYMDAEARLVLSAAWLKGLVTRGFEGAHRAAAGLTY